MTTKCEFTYIQLANSENPLLALRPRLQARLEEEPERALDVDEGARVLEREAGLAVDEAADYSVEVVGPGKEGELADRVDPATG